MKRRLIPMLLLLALVLLPAMPARAQEIRGSILGRILDPTGLGIPAARVSIINQATNVAVEVTTNEEGRYVAPFLQPAEYSIAVHKEGFARASRGRIVLQTQDRLTIDFTLKPGALSESITVIAESPMLQTASADFGQVVNNSFANRLPVVGTNPLGLTDMAPGVVPTSPDGNTMDYTTSYVRINGSSGMGNQMTIDGAPAEVPRAFGVTYVMPMSEMVEEMKVVTAMFDAAQGRTNGGSILVSTKGGTNKFHGNAYYHLRDERFNANSWTNNYRGTPRGRQNFWTAGGTIGGPIRRDRTFFNVGYEQERNDVTMEYRFRVPTALERTGDFSQTLNGLSQPLQIYDPLTTVMESGKFVSRQPFAGARIPSARFNTVGEAVVNQHPLPNYAASINQLNQINYLSSITAKNPARNLQSRIDHVLNEKHRLYFRWARNYNIRNGLVKPPVPGYHAGSNAQSDNRLANHLVIDDTMTLSPTMAASVRLGFNRINQTSVGFGDKTDPNDLKLPDTLKSYLYGGAGEGLGWPNINISDGNVPSIGPLFRQSVNNVLSLTATFSKFVSKHNLRWGVDFRNMRWFENNPGTTQSGQYTFAKALTRATDNANSETTSGSGLASLLLGLPTAGYIGRTPATATQSNYTGFFIQDDYRITSRLTLGLGLRYDVETPMTERYDRFVYDFVPDADLGINVPGMGPMQGGIRFVNTGGLPRRQGKVDRNNFGPRISAAYQLNGKTVVRAGWGLFYEGLMNNISGWSPEVGATYSFSTAYVGSSDGYRTVLPGVDLTNPFPNGLTPITGNSLGLLSQLGAGVNFAKADRRLPSIHQMQVSVGRELPWRSVVEIAYVGIRYNDLYRDYNLNEVPDAYRTLDNTVANPFVGILPATSSRGSGANITANLLKVRFPQFTSVNQQLTNGPWGRYHGLQSRWEKRLSHGVQFVANYTFSKNITSDPQSVVNERFYKFVTDTDRTHIARLFFTADLPFGRQRHWGGNWSRWLDEVAGGWAFTWVTRFSSGAALGLSGPIGRPIPLANPVTGAGIHGCLGDPAGATPANPCLDIARVQALTGKYDITPEPPRYSWLRGPGYADHDAVMFKRFRIVERVGFELRAEVNNLLNTPQWGDPRTDITNPRTFGTINSGGNPRSVRFTGKLSF